MTREEALRLATETVDKLASTPTNSRGFPLDGFRAPTLAERVAAILELARFLMASAEPTVAPWPGVSGGGLVRNGGET